MKAILFIKKRKLAKEINQVKIRLKNNNISYNKKAIKWLELWLNSELSFKAYYQTKLQKVKAIENKLKSIFNTHDLFLKLI